MSGRCSSSASPLHESDTLSSAQPSPIMSNPSTHVNDSTLLTTFDSTDSPRDKLGSPSTAPHPMPSSASPSSIPERIPSTSSFSNGAPPLASTFASMPLSAPADTAAPAVNHGVSPVISAFRSPYPPSPSYFVTVVPPDDYPMSPQTSRNERDRLQRGSLLPLYPTLGGQLWAISREFALPSLGGLMLYLADDGQGNRGPRIGDVAWQALWARYFAEEDASSTSFSKPARGSTPSRRSSTAAGDSSVGPSLPSGAYAADLSRSTFGEASSSRPTIPYISARPSPRVEALAFPRRDTSADWSPCARSAAWSSAHASSSAARVPAPLAPFPQLPILARIEWQVDLNKASWWPGWVASRSTVRERPPHKTRRSMHLADNLSQNTAHGLGVHHHDQAEEAVGAIHHDDDDGEDDHRVIQLPSTRNPDTQAHTPSIEHLDTADSISHVQVTKGPADQKQKQATTLAAVAAEPERHSTLDEPLRSARASIVSMSSDGSRRLSSSSHTSAAPAAQPNPIDAQEDAQVLVSSAVSEAEHSRSTSPHLHRDSSAALLSNQDASDQSRTGYTEILEGNDADDQETDRDGEYSLDPPMLVHHAEYSALPDSPSSEAQPSAGHAAPSSAHDETAFPQQEFPLRHSFILDAGDELMWRDLHDHDLQHMFPEPREQVNTQPLQVNRSDAVHHSEHMHLEPRYDGFSANNHAAKPQNQLTATRWAPAELEQHPQKHHRHQSLGYGDNFASDVQYSPRRSNMARIQSWIGKTPTGRPTSSGGFDDDFGHEAEGDEFQLPIESDIDEVVGLWAAKVHSDPYDVPHISGPIAPPKADNDATAATALADARIDGPQHQAAEAQDNVEQSTLSTAPAPAFSLLSPIHLDAAAFDGVKPQLGNLTVKPAPQLLSPTAAADAFDTPRAATSQRSASTPVIQQHPPTSPASLAPPLNRRPSSASRRSSGDLSDALVEMQRAVELLSPACSPNPGLGQSPDPNGRKMSSRDSLAYARSISASVTPSPKWFARAKTATAKGRSHARSTFAAGGSPFDRGQVSPRPASTSAVSSSRCRPNGLPAPLSASRLIDFAQVEAMPRHAKTEVGDDAESMRSGPTFSDSAPLVAADKAQAESVTAATPKAGTRELDATDRHAVDESVEDSPSPVLASFEATGSSEYPEQKSKPDETEHSRESSSFMGDNDEDNIARIQHFLRGKVVSDADSDASVLHDLSNFAMVQQQTSSADGTIIERSVSLTSHSRSATPEQRANAAHASGSISQGIDKAVPQEDAHVVNQKSPADERWSQASYATGLYSSHQPSTYSPNSNSPQRNLHHEVRTPNFAYDAHLGSEPTTLDTQLSSAGASGDGEGLSVADHVVKSYLSGSPSDEAFFVSSEPTDARSSRLEEQQQEAQQATAMDGESSPDGAGNSQTQTMSRVEQPKDDEAGEPQSPFGAASAGGPAAKNDSIPVLAYRFASSPIHHDTFPLNRQLAGTHDDTLDEDEIRTMNEDTRAAVREALSQSTAHNVIIAPAVASASVSSSSAINGTQSPKSSASPTASPLSSHSSIGDPFRGRGSASSASFAPTAGVSGSNASSPNLNSTKQRPSRLNLNTDGLSRSPPSNAASARRLPSTSPRSRFGQLPPSPSLHPNFKAALSSPLSQTFPVMGMGSPQSKGMPPSLASVTTLDGEIA